MSEAQRNLVIEGWRVINHSYAIVNQFQLLEMRRHQKLALWHTDAIFHYAHWNRATNGIGFHAQDEQFITEIPAPPIDLRPEWTYRIFSSVDLRPADNGSRLAVFLVTELGLDEKTFVTGSDIRNFESGGNIIVTPSRWARDLIIDWGFQADTVRVVPHGASTEYFHPLPAESIRNQRTALGFHEDETLLLNIGAAIWNKGIDLLLKAFAIARQQRKDLRLIFKDQRNTYGISGENFVQNTLSEAGLLSNDVLNAITLIPANLTMDQMNIMYGLADCYVSPYRAEGFNLPALEAMACHTPIIVTEGGATDDFVHVKEGNRKVRATLIKNTEVQGHKVGSYLQPDIDHLVELLLATRPKALAVSPKPSDREPVPHWTSATDQLLHTLDLI